MAELTHINEQGRAKMVDVSEKADTKRIGVASGRICMQPETFALITDGKIKVLTDALPKVRKLNRNVLVGFAGDAVAAEIVEEFGRYLGHGLANLAVVTDPSVIVIGGGVSNAGDILLDYVKKYFQEKAFFANKNTEFILATLGNSAGICGAAKLIL